MSKINLRYKHKFISLKLSVLLILLSIQGVQAQQVNQALVNEQNSQKIEFPYQLTFINEIPKNKVDSLLNDLLAFNFQEENGILKNRILEKIAKTKTKEAFYLLYVGCISQPRTDNYFPPFQQLCYTIKKNGGLMLLNNYFLKEPIKETGLEKDFEREVILRCKKMNPEIYYYKNLPQEINLEIIKYEIEQFKKDNIICKSPQLLTRKNIHKIQNVHELTFIHKQAINTVDSCVSYLMDSINWNIKKNWHLVYDSIWNRIAQTKSPEALQLLYLSSWDEISPYNEYLYNLTNWIYSRVDKYFYKYYYNGKKLNIDSIGDFVFRKEVLKNIEKIAPKVYFCDQPTLYQIYSLKAHSINVSKYDKSIVKRIKKSSGILKKLKVVELENMIRRLPFIYDVRVGDCYAVQDLLTTFIFTRVYTKIIDGDRIIERVYSIKNRRFLYLGIKLGKFRSGKFIPYKSKKWKFAKAYSYPALNQVKKYCEDDANKRYSEQLGN